MEAFPTCPWQSSPARPFTGEELSIAPICSWPNVALDDAVYRWVDVNGAHTHGDYQEVWFDADQRAIRSYRAG
jgi:hypothetical protein